MIVAPLLLAAAASAGVVETITAERVLPDGRFEGLARWTAPGRPTLALALSGGGARGIAHVGVAAALADDGVELDAIAGTSMGAILGGFLSAGYEPREVQSILDTRDWNAIIIPVDRRQRVLSEVEDIRDVAALVRLRRTPGRPSAVGGLVETRLLDRELYRYFLPAEIVSGGSFDALRYRFRPVATDILTGKEVVPDSGDLVKAIRGSSAIPGVFKPVRWGDASLVDGGLVENLPSRTARAFGTDVVLGVDVGDVVPAKPVRGTFDALNRSITILTAAQLEEARKLADLVIAPAVAGISQANFSRNVDALVAAGREAYAAHREALWWILESKCSDPRRIAYDAVEVVGSPWIDGAELARRLGGERGSVTRYRLAAELARALNLGPHLDGRIEIVEGESGTTVRMVLQPSSVVRAIHVTGADVPSAETMGLPSIEGERFSLAEGRRVHAAARRYLVARGRILVFLGLASWRDDDGVLEAEVRELSVGDVDVAVEGPLDLDPMRRLFRDVRGEAFRFDKLADRLDELVVRGVIEDWSLDPALRPDGSVDVTVRARGESYWEGSAGVAWHDAYEWSAFGRLTRGNLFGRGDATELVAFGAKELQGATLRFRSEFLGGFKNLGLEAGLTFAERQVPVVDARQRFSDQDWEEERLDRAWVHLLRRLRFGIAAGFGIDRRHDRLFESASGPELVRDSTALALRLDLDRHDRLLFPTRGGSARLEVTRTIGGETLDRSELAFDQVFGIGEDAPVTVTLRGGVGTSRGATRRVDWFDPGGYRDLYGFIPYGAAAPHYARAGLVTRLRTLELGPLAIYVEAGADAVRTALQRRDLSRARTVLGYGVSATAFVRPVGPLTLGYSRNDDGASELFLTVGYDFLDR